MFAQRVSNNKTDKTLLDWSLSDLLHKQGFSSCLLFSSHFISSLPFILSYPILSYLIFVYLPHQRHHISSRPQCIPADTRHTWTQARHQVYSHIRQTGNKASRNTCPLKYETKIKKEKSAKRQSKLDNTIMYERQSLCNLKKFKVLRQISS